MDGMEKPSTKEYSLHTPRNSYDGAAFAMLRREETERMGMIAANGQKHRSGTGHGRGTDYEVDVNLPNGDKAKLFGRAGMSVESLIQPLVQDLQWTEYRVMISSSRVQVDLEESSAVLDGKEVDIEDVGAMRKKVGAEMLESEKVYYSSLNLVIDTYAEPLKKWRLHKVSQETLFGGIYGLKKLSENLLEELQDVMDRWNETKTCIGCVLNRQPNFPGVFEDYSYSYTQAVRLLREKRSTQHDNGFTAFISAQRGTAVHSLDSLLLVPNQRIQAYGKLLNDLLYATPAAHHDHLELQRVASAVAQLLDRRTEALSFADNQMKLEYIQQRFTQQLHLNRPITYLFQPTKRKKIISTSNITSPTPDFLSSCGDVQVTDSRQSKTMVFKQDQKTGGRRYIQEGPVHLTMLSKSATKERYLFLLSDVIFTAKRKATATTSSNSFHLKDRQRIRDVWVAPCPDDLQLELSDFGLEPHCSFIIGWPLFNYVATFSSPREKEMWYSLLKTQIEAPSEESQRQTVQISILNKATVGSTAYAPKKYVEVSTVQDTRDVINMALDLWKIEDDASRYCLWVNSAKEDNPVLLLGHERPYSIKLFMNTRRLDSNSGVLDESRQQQATAPLQFVLRVGQPRGPYFLGEAKQPRGRRVRNTLGKSVSSTLVTMFFRGNRAKDLSVNNEEEITASFGQPLEKVIAPDFPAWLQIALVRLYMDGPVTNGILRRSASYKMVKNLREAIDEGLEPDLASAPVLAVGALLKEFLRSVPGYVLNGDLYTEWVACLDPAGNEAKTRHVRKMMDRLPVANRMLLHNFFVTLAKIAANHLVNQMHSENVAICVSPSLLSPADDMQVLRNEVPPLIQFILVHIDDIFAGYEVPAVVKAAEAINERSSKLQNDDDDNERAESPEFSPDRGGDGDDRQQQQQQQQHTVSDPNIRSTALSSSNDELANDDDDDDDTEAAATTVSRGMAINHSGVRSFSSSTPLLSSMQEVGGVHVYPSPVTQSVGETTRAAGTNGASSSAATTATAFPTGGGDGDDDDTGASPQLPRTSNVHIPTGPGQDARSNAAAWRDADKVGGAGGGGSPAGSRLVVYRHRQAQQRAMEAQQAAPLSNPPSTDTTPSQQQEQQQKGRTKLHSSASMFVDQLATGRSPNMPHRTAADLNAEAAAGTRNLQELYEIYSVKTHGKQQQHGGGGGGSGKRASISLPATGYHSLPATPSHASNLSPAMLRAVAAGQMDPPLQQLQQPQPQQVQSERARRSLGRHWYSMDEQRSADAGDTFVPPPPAQNLPSSPRSTTAGSTPATATSSSQRPAARVAATDDALYAALHERLGLLPRPDAATLGGDGTAAAARQRVPALRMQHVSAAAASFDDSSSDSGSEESDDNGNGSGGLAPPGTTPAAYRHHLQAHDKYLQQQHTRSLGKTRGAVAAAAAGAGGAGGGPGGGAGGHLSATLFTRRSSVPAQQPQPSRVTTKAFELPMPRQPVFEDVKFDEESYV